MGFKEVVSLEADVTVALGKKDKATGKAYPKTAEGYYLGSRTVEGKRGPSTLHFLKTPKGNLGVWGTTDLNRKLAQVPGGTMVRITSTGTKPTKNGDMYTYRVEQDTEETIEVQLAPALAAAADDDGADDEATGYGAEDEDDAGDEDGGGYEAAADEDEEAAAAVAAADADAARKRRQAQVQAMLNKNKSK